MPWPLRGVRPTLPGPNGMFGAIRKHDVHTGIDLYCPLNTEVVAVEDGEVIAVEPFTGVEADSPWWNDTHAVLVRGVSGVVVYGEIEPRVQVGGLLQAGDCVGIISKPVLKKDKGVTPTTMLHLELMTPDATTSTPDPERVCRGWHLGEPQPRELLDPTLLLRSFLK